MKRLLAAIALIVPGVALVLLMSGPGTPAGKGGGDQADSARFVLNFPLHPEHNGEQYTGQVVYCGVATFSEPFRFDIVATAPPLLQIDGDPTSPYQPGHEASGWLDVKLQDSSGGEGQEAYRVPTNDSLAFGLTLGANPAKDQLLRVTSLPLGDVDGGGTDFRGVATVLAQPGATDPFAGDGRSDNFCVTVGVAGAPPDGLGFPEAEFQQGQISTTLTVPDDWVVDGDGSDGGVLLGVPQ